MAHRAHARKVLAVDPTEPTKELEWSVTYLFRLIDYNEEGYLTQDKMEEAFAHWGLPTEFAKEITVACQPDESGHVSFSEFLAFFVHKEEQLKKLFYTMDTSRSGMLSEEELESALSDSQPSVPADEVEKLVTAVGRTFPGKITLEEWSDFLLLCPAPTSPLSVYDFYHQATALDRNQAAKMTPARARPQPWKYFLAGAVAGATSRTGTAPLDRLKVLLQVQAGPAKNVKGVKAGLKAIYDDGGVRAFWRGNGVNIIKIAPESAVKFYTFERTKQYVCSDPRQLKTHHRLIAGGAAGLVSQFAIYPMELLKTHLITQSVPRGIYGTFMDIWTKEGPLTFYRGLGAALVGVVPYAAIDLTVFETLKVAYSHFFDVESPSALAMLVCGTISSTIGSTTVYPLSLIRTRLQAQGSTEDAEVYKGMWDVIQKTKARDGYRGFYKGMYPNLLKVVPAVSISYVVYEKMKVSLEIP